MGTSIRKVDFNGELCYQLDCSDFSALFCPGIGANMLRLQDTKNNLEILHYDEKISIEKLKQDICLYGIPTLYLPNRFHKGILKASDNTYNLPINEPDFNNFIHGFLHQRAFKVTNTLSDEAFCSITAEFDYDSNDEFYKYYPLDFKATITYTLSNSGLEYVFRIKNLSKNMLPVVAGNHTAINLPLSKDTNKEDLRIKANIFEKLTLNDSLVCTGEALPLKDYDLMFKEGKMNPLTTSIDNDMYSVDTTAESKDGLNVVEIFDVKSGKGIRYETGKEYKYWLFWNHWGNAGFCCPEPMSAMIDASNISLPDKITGYTELNPGETWTGFQRLSTF